MPQSYSSFLYTRNTYHELYPCSCSNFGHWSREVRRDEEPWQLGCQISTCTEHAVSVKWQVWPLHYVDHFPPRVFTTQSKPLNSVDRVFVVFSVWSFTIRVESFNFVSRLLAAREESRNPKLRCYCLHCFLSCPAPRYSQQEKALAQLISFRISSESSECDLRSLLRDCAAPMNKSPAKGLNRSKSFPGNSMLPTFHPLISSASCWQGSAYCHLPVS